MCLLQFRCPESTDYNRRAGRGEPPAAAPGGALRARPRKAEKDQDEPFDMARFRLPKAAWSSQALGLPPGLVSTVQARPRPEMPHDKESLALVDGTARCAG